MAKIKIYLEDNGQDCLWMLCDESGMVVDAGPFQAGVWKGCLIPIWDSKLVKVGAPCPINIISFQEPDCLIHKIKKIEHL